MDPHRLSGPFTGILHREDGATSQLHLIKLDFLSSSFKKLRLKFIHVTIVQIHSS